jgi:hypothetical protein
MCQFNRSLDHRARNEYLLVTLYARVLKAFSNERDNMFDNVARHHASRSRTRERSTGVCRQANGEIDSIWEKIIFYASVHELVSNRYIKD